MYGGICIVALVFKCYISFTVIVLRNLVASVQDPVRCALLL